MVAFKEYRFIATFFFPIMPGNVIYNCKPYTILFLLSFRLTQAFYLIIKVLQLREN